MGNTTLNTMDLTLILVVFCYYFHTTPSPHPPWEVLGVQSNLIGKVMSHTSEPTNYDLDTYSDHIRLFLHTMSFTPQG